MGGFSNLILTDLGTALETKVNSGTATMVFNRWGLGAGIVVNDAEVRTLLGLKDWKYWLSISEVSRPKEDQVKVSGYITPDQLLETGFTLLEIGLFAQDPDLGEILYGVLYAAPGQGDFIPALGSQAYDYAVNVYLTFSGTADIAIYFDAAGAATRQEIIEHAAFVVDPTQTGSDKKHLTNDQAKTWEDHKNDTLLHMGKNVLINGGFDIWQRGTSQAAIGYGSDDRWMNDHVGSTKTHSRQAFSPGQTDVPGNPKYYSRTIVNSVEGTNSQVSKKQLIEGADTLSGGKATLSFYARADAVKNIAVQLDQRFGTGGAPSPDVLGIGVTTISLTTMWKKFVVTLDIPNVTGKSFGTDNNDSLWLRFWFDAGSLFDSYTNALGQQNGTFDLAQIQLEAGEFATDFEQRLPGVELALCQRYFEVVGGSSGDSSTFRMGGYAGDENAYYTQIFFRTTKRTIPTITEIGEWASQNVSSAIYQYSSVFGVAMKVTPLGAGRYFYGTNTTDDKILIDAEL